MRKIRLVSSFLVFSLSAFQSIAAMASTTAKQCYDLRGSWQKYTDMPIGHLTQFQDEVGASRFLTEFPGSLATETEWLDAQISHEPHFDPRCLPGDTHRRCEHPDSKFGVTTTIHFETNGFGFDLVSQDELLSDAKLTLGGHLYWAMPRPCTHD